MDPLPEASSLERWQQIETLFAQARVLPPAERTAFLDAACEDATLRADLGRLLASHDQAEHFLEDLDTERAAALLHDEAIAEEPLIGPYRLVQEVGRGGMGTVYLAERATGQFQQQVALKLIKRGMDSDAILHRFLHERQILARLHHPSIARLYDGDVTSDGRPYFAMEYVDGTPITAYCDEHRLDVEARLRLFQEVCRAVHYAHQNLVVHRDLKPSNMLVTEEGELKLLDFGIARLLDEDAEAGLTLTEAGCRVMTPEYAAPEQVQGAAITTATDVYALGVVLYELLTGHRPYQFKQRTPAAIARHLSETEPERPSTVVRRAATIQHTDGTTDILPPELVSQKRGLAPDRLQRRLAGDLDTVLLKALRKEPERRYASAEAFLEDIKRHLSGLPVHARKDTLAYRTAKFIRRNRTGVAAAALVVLALLGGLGTALWQARVARQEAATAEAVADFVVRLFEQADPDAVPGEEVTARSLLEQSPEQIERELAGQPKVQAEMLQVVSRLHMALGLYEETEPLLQQALTLRRTHYGTAHPETARTLSLLGLLAYDQSEYANAEAYLREAVQIQKATYGNNHLEVATTLQRLASVSRNQDKLVEAESLYRQVFSIRQRHLSSTNPDLADAMSGLAYVLRRAGNYGAETDSLYRQALAIYQQNYGDLHSATLDAMGAYSSFLQDKGAYEQAETLSREALSLTRQLFGEEHPTTGHAYHTLARLMSIQRNREAADSLYRQALQIYRSVYGNEHAYVGVTLSNLGAVQVDRQQYAEAEVLLREALEVYRRRYGSEHWYVAISTNELARLANKTGDVQQAEKRYREALALFRTSRPPGHPITGTSLQELGKLLLKQGRAAEAEPLLVEAEQSWAEAFAEDDWRLLDVRQDLGSCLLALNRFEEAEALLLHIYPTQKQKYGATDERTTATRQYLADLYIAWGKPDQARAYLTAPAP